MSIPIENATQTWRCWYCYREGKPPRVASVRAFAGASGYGGSGGGFPGCAEHAKHAIESALRTLGSPRIARNWKVDAFEVVDDGYGWPKLGRCLFIAYRRDRDRPAQLES